MQERETFVFQDVEGTVQLDGQERDYEREPDNEGGCAESAEEDFAQPDE